MRRFALSLVAAATLGGTAIQTASAADLPVKAVPLVAVAAAFNWTGFYVGVNVGGAWGKSDTDSPLANSVCGTCYIASVVADINAHRLQTIDRSGFTGGLQAGFNQQVNNFVWGLEADFNSFRLSGTSSASAFFTFFPGPGTPPTYTNSLSTSWLFTGRGRLGLAFGPWLFYGTGGLAVTNLSYTHTFAEGVFGGTSSGVQTASVSTNKAGYVVGAGLEHALPGNWSVKAEYLYLNFGSVSATAPVVFGGVAGGSIFSSTANLSANVARIGLNKKF